MQRPTNATSFVAVEGLGYMPMMTPRDGDRGDVQEEVFIGEIMREETRAVDDRGGVARARESVGIVARGDAARAGLPREGWRGTCRGTP